MSKKILVLGGLATAIFVAYQLNVQQYLDLNYIKSHLNELRELVQANLLQALIAFGLIYIAVTALMIPGALVLTLTAGALFGNTLGIPLVSISSTLGATVAFLASRFFFRDWVENKFEQSLKTINRGLEAEGALYLLSLRLIPLFPFFLVNTVMGVTRISVPTYFFLSLVGMLPATVVYVNAGTQLGSITNPREILSTDVAGAFVALGLLPIFGNFLMRKLRLRRLYGRFSKPKKFDYNMVVIGGGSAGLVSAYIAAAGKAKVALVEKHKMGGDCLNTGCVPSKALIRSARLAHEINTASKYGLENHDPNVDFARVMNRIQQVIRKIEPHDSIERYTGLGVECLQGDARIRSPFEVEVNGRILTTKNIIIATGAKPRVPQLEGLANAGFVTSDTVWNLRKQPKRLLVLGGGPIGCELAQAFQFLGCDVILLENSNRLLPREDRDVSDFILKQMREAGVQVRTSVRLTKVSRTTRSTDSSEMERGIGNLVKVVEFVDEGMTKKVEVDEILVATGREPNVKGFGLEELGIELNASGNIIVDDQMRTKYPNIFACGDVAGPFQFTHAASHQAWFASINAMARPFKAFRIDYKTLPWVTFTRPEVARVGLNETEARAKGIEFEVTRYGIDDLDRAIADSHDEGFVKVLTAPGSDRILGVTIVADHASDSLPEFVLAMKYGLGLGKILSTIHAYPTMSEANKYVAGVWRRNHAPAELLKWAECFHRFRRYR